jgi:nucleotide-binding universal stress UspA family protein
VHRREVVVIDGEVLVGLDASVSARAALHWAASYARSTGAGLRAIHVLEWPEVHDMYVTSVIEDLMYPDDSNVDRGCRNEIRHIFREINPWPEWRLEFGQGKPGRLMVNEAADARILVVGTREHVGLGRLLVGSTSHYCLTHAPCPVVAVPAIVLATEATFGVTHVPPVSEPAREGLQA